MEAGIWSKSAPGQQPLGNCTSKFPEKPFIYWPDPVGQYPYSLQWHWTRWPVKVHATPKHSNIAHFPAKLYRAADQKSLPAFPSYRCLLWDGLKGMRWVPSISWETWGICVEKADRIQVRPESRSSSWRPGRLSTASEMMAKELQTNPT